jgi:hypothetical protein
MAQLTQLYYMSPPSAMPYIGFIDLTKSVTAHPPWIERSSPDNHCIPACTQHQITCNRNRKWKKQRKLEGWLRNVSGKPPSTLITHTHHHHAGSHRLTSSRSLPHHSTIKLALSALEPGFPCLLITDIPAPTHAARMIANATTRSGRSIAFGIRTV